jgi:hypothetical protein
LGILVEQLEPELPFVAEQSVTNLRLVPRGVQEPVLAENARVATPIYNEDAGFLLRLSPRERTVRARRRQRARVHHEADRAEA